MTISVPEAVCGAACVPDAASLAVLDSVADTVYVAVALSVSVPGVALVEWEIVALSVPEDVSGTAYVSDVASLAVADTVYDADAMSVPVPGVALVVWEIVVML